MYITPHVEKRVHGREKTKVDQVERKNQRMKYLKELMLFCEAVEAFSGFSEEDDSPTDELTSHFCYLVMKAHHIVSKNFFAGTRKIDEFTHLWQILGTKEDTPDATDDNQFEPRKHGSISCV
jgi:hypothetical protein